MFTFSFSSSFVDSKSFCNGSQIQSKCISTLICTPFTLSSTVEKQKSLSVSGIILPPHVVVGQKGRVTVSIEGRRVDRVETSWFLNDTPIADTSRKGTTAQPNPLLRRDAQVHQLDHALYLDMMHRYTS